MINEQARTLNPDLNINIQEYADLLIERFSNRNVAHRTGQIAWTVRKSFPSERWRPGWNCISKNKTMLFCHCSLLVWLHYVIDAVEKSQSVADPMNDQLQALIKEQQDAWQQRSHYCTLAPYWWFKQPSAIYKWNKNRLCKYKKQRHQATISQLLSEWAEMKTLIWSAVLALWNMWKRIFPHQQIMKCC